MDSGLAADLRRLVGSDCVSTTKEHLDRYGGDALGVFRAFGAASRLSATPAVVVWPGSTAEVSAVLKTANRLRVPVVPYGAGTGVMGAATPTDGCIVLNLQRMNSILDVSPDDGYARLQPGVVLEDAATAMARAGLQLGHDPWSRPIATVGGAISTNGVGYTAARHGSMGEQVLGLEAVLADGEVIRTKEVPMASSGPSLEHLFIGSEGAFGVITEATINAFPEPEACIIRAVDFPDFESGFHAITRLYAEGVRPTVVDYGEEPQSDDTDSRLDIVFEGFRKDVEAHWERAKVICENHGGRVGSQAEAQRFWDSRHASGERYKREVIENSAGATQRRRRSGYRMDYLHVALPTSKVIEYRRRCSQMLEPNGIDVREWSIWARPEFFSFLIVEKGDQGGETSPALRSVVDRVLTLAQEMGGAMEYCHGVGIKLSHLLGQEMGTGLATVRKMKKALDPNNILNPGKVVG